MRFRAILCPPALIVLCFAVGTLVQGSVCKASVENQSVSGRISSVGDAEFTVALPKDEDKQHTQNVEFFVDDKTRVEGKLAIGAQALVEYRSDSGRNIAVHVVVTQSPAADIRSQQGGR